MKSINFIGHNISLLSLLVGTKTKFGSWMSVRVCVCGRVRAYNGSNGTKDAKEAFLVSTHFAFNSVENHRNHPLFDVTAVSLSLSPRLPFVFLLSHSFDVTFGVCASSPRYHNGIDNNNQVEAASWRSVLPNRRRFDNRARGSHERESEPIFFTPQNSYSLLVICVAPSQGVANGRKYVAPIRNAQIFKCIHDNVSHRAHVTISPFT